MINFLIFFILGAIIGSFLNVVVLRYNTGLSFVKGRSKCFSCGKELKWYELLPILSFLFLKGRCSECGSKISLQYPLVEFVTGIVFSLVFFKTNLSILLPVYLVVSAILIAMSVYDLKHKIIPDGLVFTFDAIALILFFIKIGFTGAFSGQGFLDLLAGPILFIFFALLWSISSGKWMGFGDAKLALGVGWFLGLIGGISAIMFAFWIGAIFSLIVMALEKLNLSRLGLTIKSEIPFAPFIIIAVLLEFLTNWNVLQISYSLHF